MRDALSKLIIPGILTCMFAAAGCSTVTSVYRYLSEPSTGMPVSVKPDKSGLKKRVLLLPCLNQASLSPKRFEEVETQLISLLEKDQQLLLQKSDEPIATTVKMRSPKFGVVTDTDVAKRAEEMGTHVLVTVVLNPYELRLKRTGVWPFRKLKREVEISMVVNALDVINGTLLLTNLESEKLEYGVDEDLEEEMEGKKPEMPEIDDKTFSRVWSRIVQRQASSLTTALRKQPWTGRILSSNGTSIVVNAGSSVGLSSGKVFEVFSRGEAIRSAAGASVYLLGPKIGEIRTVEVMEHSASAEPLNEARYLPGQVIRVKN